MSKAVIMAIIAAIVLTAVFTALLYWGGGWARLLGGRGPKLRAFPKRLEFTVRVGEEARGEVRVENVGGGEAHVSARLRRHKGVVIPSSFVLGAGSRRNVTFKIRVPKPGLFNGSLALKYEGGVVEIPILINATERRVVGPAPPPAPPSEEAFDVVLSISFSAEAKEEGRRAAGEGSEHCVSQLSVSGAADLYLRLEKQGANTYRATGRLVIRGYRMDAEYVYTAYMRGEMVSRNENRASGESQEGGTYLVFMVIETDSSGRVERVDFLVNEKPVEDLAYPAGGATADVSVCARGPSGFLCENRTLTNYTMCVSYLDIKYALERLGVNLLKKGVYTGSFDVTVSGPEGIASTVYACKAIAKCPLHLVPSVTIHFTARVEVKEA